MRLQELFLVETTEEDRAIISLANVIYRHIQKYADYINPGDPNPVDTGEIKDFCDTPLEALDVIHIELQNGDALRERLKKEDVKADDENPNKVTSGAWFNRLETITLNFDRIYSNSMKSVIVHELRHALDDFKSEGRASSSERYGTPKKKEHRKKDPYTKNFPYLAQPAEINARFVQVLDALANTIADESDLPTDQLRAHALKKLKIYFRNLEISSIFPEKEQSRDYKRLIKRAVDFIYKEVDHIKSK
jgi:hypothetical protein